MTLDAAGAMILTNIDQDTILHVQFKYQHVFKKFPNSSVRQGPRISQNLPPYLQNSLFIAFSYL